jgi:hypothetical protein
MDEMNHTNYLKIVELTYLWTAHMAFLGHR